MVDVESKIAEVEGHVDQCNELLSNLDYTPHNQQYIDTIRRIRGHHLRDLEILNKAFTIIKLSRRKKYWRDNVLIRDNFTCQRCGGHDELTVHHIIPRWTCTTDMKWVEYNGVTLCMKCHRSWHDAFDATDNLRLFLRWLNGTPIYKY